MPRVYATCNIVISPVLEVKPIRKKTAEVNMDILSGMNAGQKPITLIIRGENFARVMELMTVYHQTDEALVKKVRDSILASEVEGMTDEEVAAWARGNVITELQEMA